MPSNENGKIIKQVKIGKKKVVIVFDDASKLEISPNTFTEYNLYPKKPLSDKTIKEIKKRDSFDKYYQYALNTVSMKDISEKALREKLVKKGAKQSDINEIIKSLRRYNLINEADIVKDYLEYAEYKLYGENRIKDELYKKGVDKKYIDEIRFDDSRELEKAKSLMKKSERKYESSSYQDKKRHLYDLLLRYGYDMNIASSAVDSLNSFDKKSELTNLKKEYKKIYDRYKNKYEGHELTEKVVNYLLRKGYRYADINNIKGDK